MPIFSARGQINHLPCIFAKALGARQAVCSLSCPRLGSATLLCTQPLMRAACARLKGLLRHNARFVFARSGLPPASSDRYLQCSGLAALRRLLDADSPAADVQHLLICAEQRYQRLDDLPFAELVREMARWRASKDSA